VAISTVYAESPEHVIAELKALRAALPPAITVVAGGAGAIAISAELGRDGIQVVRDLAELRASLEGITIGE